MFRFSFSIVFILFLFACGNEPQQMTPVDRGGSALDRATQSQERSNLGTNTPQGVDDEAYEVSVQEVLQADKYTYLRVDQGQEERWLAVSKMDAKVGDRYIYDRALMKSNFYSREFDRTFERIYLVSRIMPANANTSAAPKSGGGSEEWKRAEVSPAEGTIGLKELVSNPGAYQGQEIQVKGQVVKVNSNIMGRNWIHLQDGSKMDDQFTDLTVTSQEVFPVGAIVILKGTVVTNQDFGAGYKYAVLLENATMVR